MSGFLSIRGRNRLVVMSDAATYTDEGVLTAIGSKLIALPGTNAVITSIGPSWLVSELLEFIADRTPSTFDKFVSILPKELEAFERSSIGASLWAGRPVQYQMFIAGWSERRNEPAAYQIFGRDMPVRADMPGQRPYKLMPSQHITVEGPRAEPPSQFMQWLDDVHHGRSSLDLFDAMSVGVPCFEAMRAVKSTLAKNPSGVSIHHIGGFIELVEITKLGCQRSIVRKWDDQIGSVIDPFKRTTSRYGLQTIAHMDRGLNHGLANTSNGAFKTLQKAIDTACALDLSSFSVTIQVADGTYTDPIICKSYIGVGPIIIQGNTTTPDNVVISTTSADAVKADTVLGKYKLDGLKIQTTTSGYGILAANNSVLDVYRVNYGACVQAHLAASGNATITMNSSYSIDGGSGYHMLGINGGIIVAASAVTATLTGTPAFSVTLNALNMGEISVANITWSGSATGTRYNSSDLSLLVTGGNTIPGNVAGSGTNPGVAPYGRVS